MSENARLDELALEIAEEVLRAIYGDDFIGCQVTPDQIAAVISGRLKTERSQTRELLELYEKVVEAIHLLSTPPGTNTMTDPNEVRTFLGERLDSIHAVTTRTMTTTAAAKRKP